MNTPPGSPASMSPPKTLQTPAMNQPFHTHVVLPAPCSQACCSPMTPVRSPGPRGSRPPSSTATYDGISPRSADAEPTESMPVPRASTATNANKPFLKLISQLLLSRTAPAVQPSVRQVRRTLLTHGFKLCTAKYLTHPNSHI